MSQHAMLVAGTEIALSQSASTNLTADLATASYDNIHCISTSGVSYEVGDQEEIETTTLCSNNFREYLLGLKDPGNLSFTIHYKPTDEIYQKLKSAQSSGETRIIKITFPDGSEFATLGLVKPFGFSGELSGVYSAEVTIRLSGEPKETLPQAPAPQPTVTTPTVTITHNDTDGNSKDDNTTVSGTTTANANVHIDTNADGVIDANVTADASGNYTYTTSTPIAKDTVVTVTATKTGMTNSQAGTATSPVVAV